MDTNGCALHIEAIFGDVRIAKSRQVWGHNGELIRELRNQGPPHPRGLGVAMEKDHGRPVASCEVVNLDPIDLAESRFERIGTGLRLASCCNSRRQENGEKHSCL